MKAMIKSIQFMGVAVIFLALAACGKSDNNNNVAAVQYHVSNGACYDVNNSPVTYSLCNGVAGTTSGQFQYINGQCLSIVNNQAVDPTYCTSQYGAYGTTGYGTTYPYGTTGYPYGTTYGSTYGSTYGTGYGAYGYAGYGYGTTAYAGAQNCTGRMMYIYTGYSAQLIMCGYGNCSGQFLTDVQTKQRVLCQ